MRWLATLLVLGLAACAQSQAPNVVADASARPQRIISLDYCADQYVLKLADRAQILALSPDAVKDFSYMREAARDIPKVRPRLEDVLILKPDLVVRSHGGGPNVAATLERAGIRVLQVGWASNIDGEDIGSIPHLIEEMADGLGQSERGTALVAAYRARLEAVKARASPQKALYMTPAGATTGEGSLVHEMMRAAGLQNYVESPGWRSLPLERMVYDPPELVVAAFYETLASYPDAWSTSKHPIARAQLETSKTIPLQGAWLACGGWFIMDAIEELAAEGEE